MGKILVHICCAPDALYFLKRLREDFPTEKIVGYFYDPNIHPYEEYRLRYVETERACKELGIDLIEGDYELEEWMERVKGLEEEPERGERCSVCFDIRLERSAKVAKGIGCESFTTTLLMSPKKKFHQLKESGEKVARSYGIKFLALDYRKGGGTQEMFKLSREKEFYQQDYCGCVHALFQQKGEKALFDLVSLGGRRPGTKEERLFIKEVRIFAQELSLQVREYEFPFLNWVPLQGGVWIGKEVVPSLPVPFSRSVKGRLRAEVSEAVGDTLYLSKGFVRLVLVDELADTPLEEASFLSCPTFLVPRSFGERLLQNRIEVRLSVEFTDATSSILVIGSQDAKHILGIPADTLQDGRGVRASWVKEFLSHREEELRKGELAVVLLGAHSLGKVGRRFFEERTGKKIEEEIPYHSFKEVPLCPGL